MNFYFFVSGRLSSSQDMTDNFDEIRLLRYAILPSYFSNVVNFGLLTFAKLRTIYPGQELTGNKIHIHFQRPKVYQFVLGNSPPQREKIVFPPSIFRGDLFNYLGVESCVCLGMFFRSIKTSRSSLEFHSSGT